MIAYIETKPKTIGLVQYPVFSVNCRMEMQQGHNDSSHTFRDARMALPTNLVLLLAYYYVRLGSSQQGRWRLIMSCGWWYSALQLICSSVSGEPASSSETLLPTYKTTRRHIPECSNNFYYYFYELDAWNLIPYKDLFCHLPHPEHLSCTHNGFGVLLPGINAAGLWLWPFTSIYF